MSVRLSFVIKSAAFLLPLALGVVLAFASYIPAFTNPAVSGDAYGNDWRVFRDAIRSGDPYAHPEFFSPPWVLIPLAPFAILPPGVDILALMAVSLSAWVFSMRRLGAGWYIVALMLLTPQLWWMVWFGNIDFFVPLGLIMPPQIGLFFVLSKPQAGFTIALFWLAEAFHRGGIREVVRVFAPITLVSLVSCIPFGFWPLEMLDATDVAWNISPFPLLIPIGAILLYRAIRDRRQGFAVLASPFVSPYVGVQSLPIVVLGLLPSRTETIIAITCLWFIWLYPAIIYAHRL